MSILRKIFLGLVLLAALYGALLLAEWLTTQELTRVGTTSQEAICLMWKPQFLTSNGVCYLNLLDPQGRVTDTAKLGVLDTGFNALQQFGQIGVEGNEVIVSNLRTGETSHRFVVREGRLVAK